MAFLFELPTLFFVLVLGASVGSFLNVVVYRLPAGLSLLHPPSRCPRCLTPLRPYENVPVLGWLWLKGRCAHCHAPISARYPLIEAATALLFLGTYWIFGGSLHTVGLWVFFSLLLVLALIDLDTFLLPLRPMQAGVIAGLVFQIVQGYGAQGWRGAVEYGVGSVLASVLGLWLLDLIMVVGTLLLGQAAMGSGDGKLAAMMGAWLGWKALLLACFIACLVGSIVGVGAMATGRLQRRQAMPFGPFLALGALIAALVGDRLLTAYSQFFYLGF
jgi:leader peptidase (prepilin peptidase) / N-methyltransferase